MRSFKIGLCGIVIGIVALGLGTGCRSKSAIVKEKAPAKPVQTTAAVREQTPPAPAKDPRETRDQEVIHVVQDAFFEFDSAMLTIDARDALAQSAGWLEQNRKAGIVIEGHCDERGTEQYNLALGEKRAAAARDYLVVLGVDGSRMRTVSYGESRPFEQGTSENAWAKNRRAHLAIREAE